jgi:hypothetical protein
MSVVDVVGGVGSVRRIVAQRLAPLQVAVALQGFLLWVPVEKLFMTQIGFNARSIGLMAAAYAAVVPLLEVPSGILADRWSRTWIMVCASVAVMLSTLIGGLSTNVATYIVAAMFLGVFFALNSGTVDSVVYDVVLEETGSSEQYEIWIGRVRMVEGGSFVLSALAGGVLAAWTSPRVTYFVSIPFVVAAVAAFFRFDEPRLHRATEAVALRRHVALTFHTMIRQPGMRRAVLLAALTALVSQAVFEFGPLWLVAFAAPAALFGPYWAALVSTLGIGGFLTGRLNLDRRAVMLVLAVGAPAASIILAWTHALAAVILAQIVLALLLAIVGIRAGKLLHDGVPSNIRAGISSGAGTLAWILFLPFSLAFGSIAHAYGVNRAGWIMAGATVLIAVLLVASIAGPPAPAEPEEFACQDLVELLTDYLEGTLSPQLVETLQAHLAECDGCGEYLKQFEFTIAALHQAGRGSQLDKR